MEKKDKQEMKMRARKKILERDRLSEIEMAKSVTELGESLNDKKVTTEGETPTSPTDILKIIKSLK